MGSSVRAILIRIDGFRKSIDIARRMPVISMMGAGALDIRPYDESVKDLKISTTEFRFEREYEDEFGNHILIYKEMP